MKRISKVCLIVISINFLMVSLVFVQPTEADKDAKVIHLYLSQHTPDGLVLDNGAWGKFKYNSKDGSFVFKGHGLMPDTNYNLIWFTNPAPDSTFVCLGEALTGEDGNILIKGARISLTDTASPYLSVWLVPSDDITCDATLDNWNPDLYLYPLMNDTVFDALLFFRKKMGPPPQFQRDFSMPEVERKIFHEEFERWVLGCDSCPVSVDEERLEEMRQQIEAADAEAEQARGRLQCSECQIRLLNDMILEMFCLQRCGMGEAWGGGESDSCYCPPVDVTRCDSICNY